MEFAAAVALLETFTAESASRRHPGRLDRMRAFLRLLGDPQNSFRSIHVGGTAGKGSTATMCAAILGSAGHKVGLHTKPHLSNVTERARINGVPIEESRFAALLADMVPAIDRMRDGSFGVPSYFEILVALSFIFFAREKVDIALIEVGVGGRLDGTNVIHPLVSILTNVGFDHVEILGNTIEEIATDKCGIIKTDVPIVTAARRPAALEIIRTAARSKRAPLTVVHEAARIEKLPPLTQYAQACQVTTARAAYQLTMPLLGEFQSVNAATAILACERLPESVAPQPSEVVAGLSTLSLPGRMEFYPSRPSVMFDVAHNVEKAAALRRGLESSFAGRRLIFVCAIAEGKDVEGMIALWSGLPAHFIFTTFDVPHRAAVPAQKAAQIAEHHGVPARVVEHPKTALAAARGLALDDDVVIVTGSTFIVAMLRSWFLDDPAPLGPLHV